MQCVIKRKLFKHSRGNQQQDHKKEHDPGDRVFDKRAHIVPCDHFRFIGYKPKPLRPGHERKQHQKSENPEDHLESDQALYIFSEKSKRAKYALEPVDYSIHFRIPHSPGSL